MRLYGGLFNGQRYGPGISTNLGSARIGLSLTGRPWLKVSARQTLRNGGGWTWRGQLTGLIIWAVLTVIAWHCMLPGG